MPAFAGQDTYPIAAVPHPATRERQKSIAVQAEPKVIAEMNTIAPMLGLVARTKNAASAFRSTSANRTPLELTSEVRLHSRQKRINVRARYVHMRHKT